MAFKLMTAVALVGGAGWTYATQASWSRAPFIQAAAALWFAQLVLYSIWELMLYPTLFSSLRHLPTPGGGHWLLGHGRKILAAKPGAPMREWALNIRNEGIIRYYWFFNRERLLITSPKALAEVLVTNNYAFQKPENVRSFLGRILGYGVLLAEGDEHKRQRRNLMPAFAFRHIKDLYPLFWDKAREVTEAMTRECGNDGQAQMEVSEWASRVTLDIIGVAGLGKDFNAIQDETNDLVQTYQFLFKPKPPAKFLVFLATVVPTWLLHRLPLKRNQAINEAANTIKDVCRDLIREKKGKMMANKERTDVDILSVAIESGQFTDENLIDQLMTFLAAGHETTSTALTWAIYFLCCFPEMQTRLRSEIRERLPSTDDAGARITSLDIDHMPYLNAVCNEVLRYFSPVPITVRETAYDTTIQGVPVRKGIRVVLAPFAVNVDPKLWGSDAADFNPDRWLSADGQSDDSNKKAASGGAVSNYAFMTFLHGPRSCIGSSFAKAEFACLLAAWVGRFEFELVNKEEMDMNKIDIKGGVTARPANGLHVRTKVVPGY
ncbi:isotrichodermin c-15 hydroxylase cytochrome p-450 monooxygenase cyp65a1 [Trichoderma arundinaceum]|uniref:Isotrichodermin c-15 hydroxylase cytochrome p-450 monooxygenase cyp65a1 n=1 Tax=Trichoderma arundinaceum TaxID=490622 RepID=A0A395NJY5_TRIAR|nr:isotrichodermin c-15 hydroxylase cytochrome p-450 monooxygenase cyp65a1 [Trichoderma arundinaceum]